MEPRSHDTWEKIAAFADGELSAEECCTLLREAMAQPDQARCVEHQQQLRKLLTGCMDCKKTMRCPDELKRCIEGLADEYCGCDESKTAAASAPPTANPAATDGTASRPGVLASLGTWFPLATAAALFIAAAALFFNTPNAIDQGPSQGNANPGLAAAQASPLSTSLVSHFEKRHVRCSSGVTPLFRTDLFPDNIELLNDALAQQLAPGLADMPLDLSSIGYAYRVAGLCNVPGRGAVHIVYASEQPDTHGRHKSMSLWIKPYDADKDPQIEAGVPTVGADESYPHPILLWRDDAMIYYLVGDALPEVEKAQKQLTQLAIAS